MENERLDEGGEGVVSRGGQNTAAGAALTFCESNGFWITGFESNLRSYPINSFAFFANEWGGGAARNTYQLG